MSLGLAFGYFCFGQQAIHIAGLPALCYIVIRTQDPRIVQRWVAKMMTPNEELKTHLLFLLQKRLAGGHGLPVVRAPDASDLRLRFLCTGHNRAADDHHAEGDQPGI